MSARLASLLALGTLLAACFPVADAPPDGPLAGPPDAPGSAAIHPAPTTLTRTGNDETNRLVTDRAGKDQPVALQTFPAGCAPDACSEAIPADATVQSYVLASRRVADLAAGETLDVTAMMAISAEESELGYPDTNAWTHPETAKGELVLADAPTATTGELLTNPAGGVIPWLQHHAPYAARGVHVIDAADPALTWQAQNQTDHGDHAVYVNYVVQSRTPAYTQMLYLVFGSAYSHLAVQRFPAPAAGAAPLALDQSAPAVTAYSQPISSKEINIAIWASAPLTNVKPTDIIQAHADVGFAFNGNTTTPPPSNPNDINNQGCSELVDAQLYLSRDPHPTNFENTARIRPMSQSLGKNLTYVAYKGDVSVHGSIQPSAAWPGDTAWIASTMYVVLAMDQEDQNFCNSGTVVRVDPAASHAYAMRFRTAGAGDAVWTHAAAAATATAKVTTVTPGVDGALGAERVVYSQPVMVQAGDVIDASGAIELKNPGTTDPQVVANLRFDATGDGGAPDPVPASGLPAFDTPSVETFDHTQKELAIVHTGAYVVPASIGAGPHAVWVTYSVAAAEPAGVTTATDLAVEAAGGQLALHVYRP